MTDSELAISVLQGIRQDLERCNRNRTDRLDATNEQIDAMRAELEGWPA